jgi:hypothetical protein
MKTLKLTLCVAASLAFVQAQEKPAKLDPLGYTDTPPIFPGSPWKVHELDRPAPATVSPGHAAGEAPADAVVIFDGTSSSALKGRDDRPCPWTIENGELVVHGGDVWTRQDFASCQLHLEWKSDPKTGGNSQKKGNSGVFFMDRYETQILDCYNNPTYADGMAGAVYGQTPPLVNAVRPAGEWQTYDIVFTAPKFEQGKLVEPAYVTAILNGIVVQNHTKILGPTMHRLAASYDEKNAAELQKLTYDLQELFPATAPIRLQDHGNTIPNRFRNIWVRPL